MTSDAGGEASISITSPGTPSLGENPPRTPAERAREKRLREDPMADVHGPLFVTCKRCGNRIKLSPKSTYDPFHWQKHRERCLKKPVKGIKEAKREKEIQKPKHQSSPKTTADSSTPPLTPDDDEIPQLRIIKEEPPSPHINDRKSPRGRTQTVRRPDYAFEEYLFRSRRRLTRDLSPITPETWSWDQLKPPVWVIASYPVQNSEEVGTDEAMDDLDDPLPQLQNEPASALSQTIVGTFPNSSQELLPPSVKT